MPLASMQYCEKQATGKEGKKTEDIRTVASDKKLYL